jgi:hypothetical protein
MPDSIRPVREPTERSLAKADEVVRLVREVMHGREHSGTLLLAIKEYEETRDA